MTQPNLIDLRVGANLKTLRKQAGWKRVDLAAEIGIEPEKLRRFEDGLDRISPRILMKLVRVLQLEITEIFAGVVSHTPHQNEPGPDDREDPDEATLVRNFVRIRDAKTRALILSFVAAYAENEGAREGE